MKGGGACASTEAVLPFELMMRGELGLLLFEAENFLTDMSAFDKLQLPSPTPCFLSGSNSRLAFLLAGLGFLLIFS